MRDTREKLSPLSVGLHWAIGLTMIGMVIFGMIIADWHPAATDAAAKAAKSNYIGIHKSIGMIVLLVAAWRLTRRVRQGLPQHVGVYKTWEQHLAKTTHYFLLFATLALPVSGIIYTLSSARPIAVFGVPVIPQLVAEKIPALASFARGTHDIMGKLLLLAVALHIAGALKHHIVDKDGTLRRMLGARVEPTRNV
jgi:cytochrome b561